MKKFIDSSIAPIVAFDFDGVLNVGGEEIYPICGFPRKYAREVLDFLDKIGVKIVIWTSRDVSIDQDLLMVHDDITYALDFMKCNNLKFHAINKSVQFAPYKYNSRKVYAHMYVDDRAFGWRGHTEVLLEVLIDFLRDVVGIEYLMCDRIWDTLSHDKEVSDNDIRAIKSVVEQWNK